MNIKKGEYICITFSMNLIPKICYIDTKTSPCKLIVHGIFDRYLGEYSSAEEFMQNNPLYEEYDRPSIVQSRLATN